MYNCNSSNHSYRQKSVSALWLFVITLFCVSACADNGSQIQSQTEQQKPNIILVMTDDQGYGDMARNENPAIQTPNMSQLAEQSVRFTNFHMDPTCSPSRSALLTGKYSMKAGVWHTIMGRSLLPTENQTLPEKLKEAGYTTAMFGKWHLGDNYPFRPEDQGFDESLIFGGGGVGQTPDYWGNKQFDDTYFHNGKPIVFDEYSTKVWFDGAIDFIKENKDKPFFAYISTNAPHSPHRAPDNYVQHYRDQGLPEKMALYYAMITYLDDELGRLRETLKEQGIEENTLLIFTTDNGSGFKSMTMDEIAKLKERPEFANWNYNAGMRGYKASVYDGGHRDPLYISWPAGHLKSKDVNQLTAHFDLMPTLLDVAGIDAPADLDGTSLLPVLKSEQTLQDRHLVVTNQRVDIPSKDRPAVVMTNRWRYVLHGEENKTELFDMQADPGQQQDVKQAHPDVVAQLQQDYDKWWNEVSAKGFPRQRIIVGSKHENPSRLTAMDWMEAQSTDDVPWFPGFQRPQDEYHVPSWLGREEQYGELPWYLTVAKAGDYKISLYVHDKIASYPVKRVYALLDVNGKTQVVKVNKNANGADFNIHLEAGDLRLKGWFADDQNGDLKPLPAFYAYVERL